MKRQDKDWDVQGEEYEQAYSKGRTAKDLWKYVPMKYCKMVGDVYSDPSAYWIILNEGWHFETSMCHTEYTYTISDFKHLLTEIAEGELPD